MVASVDAAKPPPDRLLAIIRAHTEIARFGVDLGGLTAFAVERLADLTPAEGALVELVEGGDLVCRAACGILATRLGARARSDIGLSGRCLAEGAVLQSDDSETDDRVDRETARALGCRSLIAAPLRSGDRIVGVMKMASSVVGAFSRSDAATLELFAELVAAAMFAAARYDGDELVRRAREDPVSGLPNRAAFFERIPRDLEAARRDRLRLGLLVVTILNLSAINVSHDFRTGDAVIRETGARVRAVSRGGDMAALIGEGVFAAALTDIGDAQRARVCVDRIVGAVKAPLVFEGRSVTIEFGVGVAVFPEDGRDLPTLLGAADRAARPVG